jgi:hypothetical protein
MSEEEVSVVVEGQEHTSRQVKLSLKHEESKPPRVVIKIENPS